MKLSKILTAALEKMNITVLTEIQNQAIPEILKGSDVIGIAETGSGKTLAFALSVMTLLEKNKTKRALIMAPSREMAQQIHKVVEFLCLEYPDSANMTLTLGIAGIPTLKQLEELKLNPRIIVATPGRMNEQLLKNKLLLKNVEIIVIDEADRMIDMGFSPQLKSIEKTLRGDRQTLMFSASFDPEIEIMASVFMKKKPVMIRTRLAEKPVESLKQTVFFVHHNDKDILLLHELSKIKTGVIIFTDCQENCEALADDMLEYGFNVEMIHGGLNAGHRNRVVREFTNKKVQILVATDLLARGIDIPHVDHVINYELPYASEDFLHRIGRTARAGRSGQATTFVTGTDNITYDLIKTYLDGAEEIKADAKYISDLKAKKIEPPAKIAERKRVDKYKHLAEYKDPNKEKKKIRRY